jgi:hypothetical protein
MQVGSSETISVGGPDLSSKIQHEDPTQWNRFTEKTFLTTKGRRALDIDNLPFVSCLELRGFRNPTP